MNIITQKKIFVNFFSKKNDILNLYSRYDYWYQPHHNVMISTEWGIPKSLMGGLDVEHVAKGHYGTHLNIYDWEKHKLIQRIDLGMEGVMPLEIR